MSTRIEEVNERAMEHYRAGVTIEMTHDGTVHVTLDGEHSINDEPKFTAAVVKIFQQHPHLRSAVCAECD